MDWDSEAWMKLDHLNAINARLFLNQTTISGARQLRFTRARIRPGAFGRS